MSSMSPTLIGYFPKRTRRRADFGKLTPPTQIEEVCNAGCDWAGPENWIDLWLHNDMGVYDTEMLAWAVATDRENLKRLVEGRSSDWAIDHYIALHSMRPFSLSALGGEPLQWDLYAYRVFPARFVHGKEEPFVFPELCVQPLPADYEHLGFDAAICNMGFGDSPLSPFCNGRCWDVPVNRHCLLDDLTEAFRRAGEFSLGGAEPGRYSVVEVLRKRWTK
jgi:hypothetical protein